MDCPMAPPCNSVYALDEIKWRDLGDERRCDYCGSMHPNVFMDKIKEGVEVVPTDKSYKAYIKFGPGGQSKFYFGHLSEEQMHEFIRMLNNGEVKIAYPRYFYVIPYFIQKIAKDKVAG